MTLEQSMVTSPNDNIEISESYYKAVIDKDFKTIENLLDDQVQFLSPMADLSGKENVLNAIKGYASIVQGIKVRNRFESDDMAMIAYDVDFGGSIGICRTAALITIQSKQIKRMELFFDASSFKPAS